MNKLKLADLVVVTTNKNKLAEINEILGTNHKVSRLDIPEIQSLDLDEVITHKAKEAYAKIKKPVLVEDISLEIKALNGLPGTFVKFFLEKLGTEGTVKLVGKSKTDTTVTAAVAVYDGKDLNIFKGKVSGTLSKKNRGEGGFGFDKVFIPKGYTKTYAQMSPELKNKISHRALALKKLKQFLSKN
jgi:non-canonical purine NTP pyrophosphatase (RdgB/HAM1 family)